MTYFNSVSIQGTQNPTRKALINPTGEVNTSPVYRMVGTAFEGSTLDPNFWSDDECLRGGTVAQADGEVSLLTNTTANGLSILQSVRKGRFVAGSATKMEGAFSFKTAATANNTRRLGAYTLDGTLDVEDGFFFQFVGTAFSVGYARNGSVTAIATGSFNGNMGATWEPSADTYYKLTIEFSPMGAFWYVDSTLLHKVKAGHPSAYMTLPITIENENIGDITTEVELHCVGAYIARQGELQTNSTYKYIGTDATTVCKNSAGVLHRVIVLDNAGNIEIYDNTAGSGTVICSIDSAQGSEPLGTLEFNAPFNDGLTIVTSSSARCTVVYE